MISLHEFTCTYKDTEMHQRSSMYKKTDYYRDVKDMVFTFRITKNGIKSKTVQKALITPKIRKDRKSHKIFHPRSNTPASDHACDKLQPHQTSPEDYREPR